MKTSALALSLTLTSLAAAAGDPWAQCGGNGFSGDTSCVSGWTCVRSNEWYSQCLPSGSDENDDDDGGNDDNDNDNDNNNDNDNDNDNSGSAPTGVVTKLPSSQGSQSSSKAISVSGTYDGGMKKFERSPNVCQEQQEGGEADAMFILQPGAKLKNVIIGASQAEGVHCKGTCTLENVWWADVCEDAATFKQSSGTSYVNGGGAFKAADKIFQFNGRGTVDIKNFYANDFGKVVRSCGNCSNNGGPRHVKIADSIAVDGGPYCGINTNYGDTCSIKNSCHDGGKSCEIYVGVSGGGSSKKLSSGSGDPNCSVSGHSDDC